jgi:acyl-CoA synthetase (AMP-forming)/AMP-acid ligase II
VAHPSGLIHRAAVVGIKHIKYGEVVGAFLQSSPPSATSSERPSDETLRAWVRSVLAHHKAPTHIFWLGGQDLSTKTQMVDGMSELIEMVEMPLTGSGKMKKHVLRDLGTRIVAATEAVGNYN